MRISEYFRLIIDADYRFTKFNAKGYYKNCSDEYVLKKMYKVRMGKKINLESPQTFSEKLQWLKLYDRNPEYIKMVDKYEVKNYVAGIIGNEHIIPSIGVWDKFDDIDFDSLPNQFVLKCTHDSGGLAICRDKSTFDMTKAKGKIDNSLKRNYYLSSREWPYKDVKPRIVAEKYMEDGKSEKGLTDYKFYCFNGEPKFLYISKGLEDHSTARISFVNMDWSLAPYERTDYLTYEELPPKPECFEKMKEICRALAKDIPFIRIDLYEIEKQIYFSEMTFFPCSGFTNFKNPGHDLEIGKMLVLPEKDW